MKKEYGSPELEKLELEDEDLDNVAGGTGEIGEGGESSDLRTGCNRGEQTPFCSGSTLHRSLRSFSYGRSGC